MPSIFQEYKNYVKKYTAEYGDKTIVYMILGAFYELYNVGNLIDMKKISELTDLTISRKDKSITEISEKNYEMAGFPEGVIHKYVKIMVKNGYNVVVVGPTSPPGTSPQTREVTDIFSPGTMIDNLESYETNNIMTLYFEEIRSHSNAHKKLLTIGIGIIDLSTGKNYAHEVSSTISDYHLSLDTCYRMLTVYNPKEIIIFGKKMDDVTIEYLQDYLDCSKRYVHNKIDNFNLESLKLTYQTRILRRTFPNHGILSPIEYVNLERLPNALVAYVNLLQFAYDHNEKILDKITPPELIFEDDKLILSYNAIKQMDITGSSNNTLLRILNTATTAIGRRKFGEKFLNPIVDTNQLMSRYRFIGTLADNKHCFKIAKLMENVFDIERQFRRMNLGRMHPMGFCNIDTTMSTIIKISEYLITNGINTELLGVDDKFVTRISEFIEFYSSKLDLEEIRKYNLQNIHGSFFVKNNFPEIDAIQIELDSATGWFSELVKMMNNINDNNYFRLDNNDRDGYYLLISKIRWDDLTKKFRNHRVKVSDDFMHFPDFCSKPISAKSSNLRVTHEKFEGINKSISTNREKIRELMSKQYGDFIKECCEDWCEVFHGSIKLIGELDYYNTNARNAVKFKYSSPRIVLADKSYFSSKNLRHPIIERINESEYITNDITLGCNNIDGMLLYGTNSVGKCFRENTMIMLSDGNCKKVQDIQISDKLMGDDSTPRNVLSLTTGKDIMYNIVTTKGDGFTVNKYHILVLKGRNYIHHSYDKKTKRWRVNYWFNGKRICKSFTDSVYKDSKNESLAYKNTLKKDLKNDIIEIAVDDYIKKGNDFKANYYLFTVPVNFDHCDLPLDSYFIGLWLGDGSKHNCDITTVDDEIIEYIEKFCLENCVICKKGGTNNIRYRIKGIKWRSNLVFYTMKELNLIYNKHIPEIYKKNSHENRFKLLAGLIDSDGYNCHDTGYEIVQKNEKLADDILYLVRSLGFTSYKKLCNKSCIHNGKKFTGTYYRMYIYGPQQLYDQIPCLLERKIINKVGMDKSGIVSFKIISQPPAKYYGFQIDGNQRFLLDNFIVTHNSSLMKSIGLAIIMAQAGMWVPAAEFVFSPYHAIFTRIPSGDDIFRGQSTFTMEICELSNILKRANRNSLIIGDELCMGTETVSALAIVATCVIDLSKRGSTFICATHLHDLAEMKRIKDLANLTIQHLSMYYDDSQEIFIFDRKLKPGFGETLYGLEVCKGLHLEKHFLDLANDIRREIIGISPEIIATKRSRYNSDHYVDQCDLCSMKPKFTRIEVHHIKYQKDADINGFHDEHHKNALYNLANLCEDCHDKVHNNKIKISGWITTSSGRKLDVKVLSQQSDIDCLTNKIPVESNNLHTANHNISGTFKNIDTGNFDLLEIIARLQQNNKNKREILQHLQDNYDRGITMYRLSKLLKT